MDDPEEDWLLEDDDTDPGAVPAAPLRPWRVLVVDDDADVHAVTRLALRNVSFKGRELELFSAYSAQEGFRLLRDTADVALVLLDVVMESEDAGLVLARRIREELHNHAVRVVLRTGQPGQAPEQRVIVDYDINDYKAKTELTTQRLFTAVIAALRAYETLTMLERSRAALDQMLDGAAALYQAGAPRQFASGVLAQVGAVLDIGADGMLCVRAGDGEGDNDGDGDGDGAGAGPVVLAATGAYAALAAQPRLPPGHPLLPVIERALREPAGAPEPGGALLALRTGSGQGLCLALAASSPLAPAQRELLALYCERIAALFDGHRRLGQPRAS